MFWINNYTKKNLIFKFEVLQPVRLVSPNIPALLITSDYRISTMYNFK
jgi:hypothetical protein